MGKQTGDKRYEKWHRHNVETRNKHWITKAFMTVKEADYIQQQLPSANILKMVFDLFLKTSKVLVLATEKQRIVSYV